MKTILGFLSLVIFTTQLSAQESLSLNQAIELGLKNNFDINIVAQNVEVAEKSE